MKHSQARRPGAAPLAASPTPRTRQTGFAMIEVLIAILIAAFGLLGIAGLQAATAKLKVNSWARGAASVQFSDIADRMRANPTQAGLAFASGGSAASASLYAVTDSWADQQANTLVITTDCSLAATACTAAQRAAYDLLIWRTEVRRMFPQGAVFLTGNRATGVNATIAWFDKQNIDPTGATVNLASEAVCTAAMTGAAQINCCPAGLVGGTGTPGVRCSNASFVP